MSDPQFSISISILILNSSRESSSLYMSRSSRHYDRPRLPVRRRHEEKHDARFDTPESKRDHWQSPSPWNDQWQQGQWQQDQWQTHAWSGKNWDQSEEKHCFSDRRPYPSSWKPDPDHHDSNEVHGLSLGRTVARTNWSMDKGIAGKPIEDITIMDLAYQGPSNWFLRHISSGRFTTVEFTRSTKESMFVQCFTKALRSRSQGQSHDIDKLVMAFSDLEASPQTKVQDHYMATCNKLVDIMYKATPAQQANQYLDKIRDLENQLADARQTAAGSQRQEVPLSTLPLTTSPAKHPTIKEKLLGTATKSRIKETIPEPQAVETDVHLNHRRGDKAKVLSKDMPTTTTSSAFQKWMKATLTTSQQKAFQKQLSSMTEHYNSLPKEAKADISSLAVEWGMPVKTAANADNAFHMKMISAAIVISN